ncbi:MAG TPA: SIMPL domain-containing protein [Candidatus Udaeobacter sp.]|nr:SIMPL domain-containing protein [Candidatus Udaeobacter sp.]
MKRFLFLLYLSLPIRVFAEGGLPDKPYIYVEGKAEIQSAADIVTLRFELVFRAPDQVNANEQVQAGAMKILGLLKNRKIADRDLIAETVRTGPEFEQIESYQRHRGKLIGYVEPTL